MNVSQRTHLSWYSGMRTKAVGKMSSSHRSAEEERRVILRGQGEN